MLDYHTIYDIKIGQDKSKPINNKYLTSKIDKCKINDIYKNTSNEHRIIID